MSRLNHSIKTMWVLMSPIILVLTIKSSHRIFFYIVEVVSRYRDPQL